MEVRRVAQAVLRSQCISPEVTSRAVRDTTFKWQRPSIQQTNRQFTSRRHQSSQSAARQLEPERDELPDTKTTSPQPQRSIDPSASRPASQPPPRSTPTLRPEDLKAPNPDFPIPSKFDNILRDASAMRRTDPLNTPAMQTLSYYNRSNSPASAFGSEWSPQRNRTPARSGFDPNNIPFPRAPSILGGFDEVLPDSFDRPIAYPKLNATLGRSVTVHKDNVAEAIRKMELLCATNGIRRDFNKQKFHERPGLKRKRLVSERWRKRFKGGFVHIVKRVQKFSKQGW